jgi:hypothetical protein
MPLGKTIKFSKTRTQSPVGQANKAWNPYWTSHRGMETLLENLKRNKNLVKKLTNPLTTVATVKQKYLLEELEKTDNF